MRDAINHGTASVVERAGRNFTRFLDEHAPADWQPQQPVTR